MGYVLVDHRAYDGTVREYNTTTCRHCNAVIVYSSKPLGGFLRKVRTSYHKLRGRCEELGQGFWCHPCGGDICHWCGEAATKGGNNGPCITMERIAYETGNLISKGINVHTMGGQLLLVKEIGRRRWQIPANLPKLEPYPDGDHDW